MKPLSKRLSQVEEAVRSLVALMAEVDPKSVAVTIQVKFPEEIQQAMDRAQELRQQANELQSEAAAASRRAARKLHDMRMPLRDIGAVLGISFQRAQQLVASGR